jgi:hypothetical protein
VENKTQRESRKNVDNVVEKNEKKIPTGANSASWERLGDFTATIRWLPISTLALGIGALAAVVALVLLRLIGLFTNLFYFGRWSTALVSPSGNHLGWFSVFVSFWACCSSNGSYGPSRWAQARLEASWRHC